MSRTVQQKMNTVVQMYIQCGHFYYGVWNSVSDNSATYCVTRTHLW